MLDTDYGWFYLYAMEQPDDFNISRIKSVRDRKFYGQALRIIRDHYNDMDFNVAEMSVLLGISRVTLYRKLKRLSGDSASSFIRHARLLHASKLLAHGECSVAEAAHLSGFRNLSYFSKRFKEYFGVRPSEMGQM